MTYVQTNAQPPASPEKAKPMREEYWFELDTDKKLERIRETVKRHARTIQSLENAVRKLTLEVHNHHHFSDGKAAISIHEDHPLYAHDFGEPSISSDPNKVYF